MRSGFRAGVEEFLSKLPGADGERSTPVFEHGSIMVKLYAPRGEDTQKPHGRDEGYVVHTGSGTFVHGNSSVDFKPGDFLWAPAGLPHRFENFTDDLVVWVIFYGPEGGESGRAIRDE